MNQTFKNWAAAVAVVAVIAGASLLDGPSAAEVEAAQAADLLDAQAQARRDAPHVRAELARLEEERIEPTPAEILSRYALLGVKR